MHTPVPILWGIIVWATLFVASSTLAIMQLCGLANFCDSSVMLLIAYGCAGLLATMLSIRETWRLGKHKLCTAIPNRVVVAPNVIIPVVETELVDAYGAYDDLEERILIDPRQLAVAKHEVLLHELMHIVDIKLVDAGIVEEPPSERYTEHASGTLFLMLTASGLWNGVTPKETMEWLDTHPE